MVRHGCLLLRLFWGPDTQSILKSMKTFEGTCSECGHGELVMEGTYDRAGVRLQWARWSCGHQWPPKDGERQGWLSRRLRAGARLVPE